MHFDSAYITKCYLNERGAERVRSLAITSDGLVSREVARVEFFSVVHRLRRDEHITRREARDVPTDFEHDEAAGTWQWLPVTPGLLRRACERLRTLPPIVAIPAVDALHLTCASEHGVHGVYTNDRHMLGAARFFGLRAVNVIEE